MPKLLHSALTAAQVRAAPRGEYADGNGLSLRVGKAGGRSWVQRLRVHGRAVNVGLGSTNLVTLAEARELAYENRRIARSGQDPRRVKVPTFRQAQAHSFSRRAEEWRGGADGKAARDWSSRMERLVLPVIGTIPVDEVKTMAVDSVLRPLALQGKLPLAKAVGVHIAQVLRDAQLAEWRNGDDPVGVVVASLPKRKGEVRHAPALHHGDVAESLEKVEGEPTITLAMRFIVYTASRQIEVRRMTWDQVSMDTATWTRPAKIMKTGKAHRAPMSDQALEVLREVRLLHPRTKLVFPGKRSGTMFGDETIRNLLKRCNVPATIHGYRSSFKGWCRDNDVPELLSEFSLSHVEGSATVAAYARDDLLEKRRPVMQQWADAIS